MSFIVAAVVFHSEEEGGRRTPPLDWGKYRPHVVVGDPGQSESIVDADRVVQEKYLGVFFSGNGASFRFGLSHKVRLKLWNPNVDYSALAPGATFTIREGARIVGHGRVLSVEPATEPN